MTWSFQTPCHQTCTPNQIWRFLLRFPVHTCHSCIPYGLWGWMKYRAYKVLSVLRTDSTNRFVTGGSWLGLDRCGMPGFVAQLVCPASQKRFTQLMSQIIRDGIVRWACWLACDQEMGHFYQGVCYDSVRVALLIPGCGDGCP